MVLCRAVALEILGEVKCSWAGTLASVSLVSCQRPQVTARPQLSCDLGNNKINMCSLKNKTISCDVAGSPSPSPCDDQKPTQTVERGQMGGDKK